MTETTQRATLRTATHHKDVLPSEFIERRIYVIRGHKVMLSTHLAELYGVEPRVLVQAVKRNRERFPGDFMFALTVKEWATLKSHIVISTWGGLRRAAPYAFTEQGVAMLSGVLRSPRAIRVNIAIMRAFVRLRAFLDTHRQLAEKLATLERKLATHDKRIQAIFEVIHQLMHPFVSPRRPIGFHPTPPDTDQAKDRKR